MTESSPVYGDASNLGRIASSAWNKAIADFYHPPLPDPVIEHDSEKASHFYIDSDTWTVHLNTFGVPGDLSPEDKFRFLTSICQHEIQHYLVCPYDGVNNGMMFAAARKHVDDALAMLACNLYADLLVDSALLNRFPHETRMRIESSIVDSSNRMREHSHIWKIVIATYHAAWDFTIPDSVQILDSIMDGGQKIARISGQLHIEREWPKAVEEIAKILAELQEKGNNLLPKDKESGGVVLLPADLDAVMGSPVEDRNGDRARKCMGSERHYGEEKELEKLAMEVQRRKGTYKDLEGVYMLTGAGMRGGDWLRFWYRAGARSRVKFHVSSRERSGSIPISQDTWRLGDPLEELDLVQSLQAFPVIVPNMSTRKWMKSYTFSSRNENAMPDLLIVIDSSGSMTWSFGRNRVSGAFHLALMSAFAAIDFAHRQGKKVGVINFSGSSRTCDWTKDRRSIERTLMQYQGSGTVMPVREIKAMCKKAESENMILVITDAQISNWNPFVKTIKTLSRRGHSFFIFHIGPGKSSNVHEKLEKAGGTVIPVKSPDDLFDLVVRQVRGVYST